MRFFFKMKMMTKKNQKPDKNQNGLCTVIARTTIMTHLLTITKQEMDTLDVPLTHMHKCCNAASFQQQHGCWLGDHMERTALPSSAEASDTAVTY